MELKSLSEHESANKEIELTFGLDSLTVIESST